MFTVIFEVQPRGPQWDAYLGYAKALKAQLESIDGFIDNVRYRSLTRDGWLLSLSSWRDEKALVRWRTHMRHHEIQERGRTSVFSDYHLRVGEVTRDTRAAGDNASHQQRFDETEVGEAHVVTLIEATGPSPHAPQTGLEEIARGLGFVRGLPGLVAWDVFDAVLSPGSHVLLLSWDTKAAAESFERTFRPASGGRMRSVRIIRDYGMFDRREAPQYFPDVTR